MSEMLERASGFSILRTALRLAVGDPVGLHGPIECSRVGYLLYVFPETDVEWIDVVEGLPTLREVEGVDEIVLVRGPGQRIDWREGSEAHVFHLTGTTHDLGGTASPDRRHDPDSCKSRGTTTRPRLANDGKLLYALRLRTEPP